MNSNSPNFYDESEYVNALSDNDSDYDNNDEISHISASTITSRKNKSYRDLDKYANITPGLICIGKANKRFKEKRIDGYYTVNIPGSPIRNAVIGSYEMDHTGNTKFRVGSVWEDLFFKVVITTVKDSPYTLFYDSPEQYERHMNSSLPEEDVKRWYNKHRSATENLNIMNENTRPRDSTVIR